MTCATHYTSRGFHAKVEAPDFAMAIPTAVMKAQAVHVHQPRYEATVRHTTAGRNPTMVSLPPFKESSTLATRVAATIYPRGVWRDDSRERSFQSEGIAFTAYPLTLYRRKTKGRKCKKARTCAGSPGGGRGEWGHVGRRRLRGCVQTRPRAISSLSAPHSPPLAP